MFQEQEQKQAHRKREVRRGNDEAIISDHAFEPRGEWWSLCKHCPLAEAAHAETTLTHHDKYHYYSDDNPDDE